MSRLRTEVSRESLGRGGLAPSMVCVRCCFKNPFLYLLQGTPGLTGKILFGFFLCNMIVKESQVSWAGREVQIQPSTTVTKATAYY